jgi:hypothetical protein
MQAIAKNPESNNSTSINLPLIISAPCLRKETRTLHRLRQDATFAPEAWERFAASPDHVPLSRNNASNPDPSLFLNAEEACALSWRRCSHRVSTKSNSDFLW